MTSRAATNAEQVSNPRSDRAATGEGARRRLRPFVTLSLVGLLACAGCGADVEANAIDAAEPMMLIEPEATEPEATEARTRDDEIIALVDEAEDGDAEERGPRTEVEEEASAVEADPSSLREAVRQVTRMTRDRGLVRAARAHRMRIQNLSWEDTGRWMGSAVGPNISDLTLEVVERTTTASGRPRTRSSLLPVLRYPNFTDRTADIPADAFWVRVGNQREGARPDQLEAVPLTEVLSHLRSYLSVPESLRGDEDDFTAPRDTHYLVSAQHVFVPLPEGARVEWAPVLFNYESEPGAPAVLCLVVTREGTSTTIIENRPDPSAPGSWGQRLYFNHGGQRTLFTAERRSDVRRRIEAGQASADDASALEEGADMVMIVQVPLRVATRPRASASPSVMGYSGAAFGAGVGGGGLAPTASSRGRSHVERAVIGHGISEGPFRELGGRRLRRDRRFPIRVTIQFYRATSNGVVSGDDLEDAVRTIERVYADGDFVGSLVVGSQDRPTAWTRTPPIAP